MVPIGLRSEQTGLALTALAAGMFATATASLMVLGIGPAITHAFGRPPGSAGLLVSAFALPYAILAPFLQWWAAGRFGAGTLVVTGLLVAASGLGLTAVAPDWNLLLAARALTACGAASFGPAALVAATSLAPEEQRGRALAFVFNGFTLASVLGVPVATALDAQIGWRGTIGCIGLLALGIAPLARAALPTMDPAGRIDGRTLAGLALRPGLRNLLGSSVLQLAAQFVALAIMPALLMDHFGLAARYLPLAVLAFGLGGVVGNAVAGRWTDRASARAPLIASFVGLALALGSLLLPLGPWGGTSAMVAIAFCGTLFRPPQLVLLTCIATNAERGPVLGLNTAAGYVGLALGSALSTSVAGSLGLGMVGPFGLVLLALSWLSIRGRRWA